MPLWAQHWLAVCRGLVSGMQRFSSTTEVYLVVARFSSTTEVSKRQPNGALVSGKQRFSWTFCLG